LKYKNLYLNSTALEVWKNQLIGEMAEVPRLSAAHTRGRHLPRGPNGDKMRPTYWDDHPYSYEWMMDTYGVTIPFPDEEEISKFEEAMERATVQQRIDVVSI
jgi:hypothetical protein